MVFFVLSGYVIAFVTATKERNITDYFCARASRIYSIVLPAIIVTLICNELGNVYIGAEYTGPWHKDEPNEYLRYFVTLFMLQNVWGVELSPTNNGPFWSITFEVFYYAFYAFIFFLKGYPRLILLGTTALIAGPTVVILFPTWLLGYYAYYLCRNGPVNLNQITAYILFISGGLILAFSPQIRQFFDQTLPMIDRQSIIGDYIDSVGFFLNLVAAPIVLAKLGRFLNLFRVPIVFLSSLTFSLYLFHQPLVRFFAGVSPFISDPASLNNRLFIYSMTLLAVIVVGIPAERSKRRLRIAIKGLLTNNYITNRFTQTK